MHILMTGIAVEIESFKKKIKLTVLTKTIFFQKNLRVIISIFKPITLYPAL